MFKINRYKSLLFSFIFFLPMFMGGLVVFAQQDTVNIHRDSIAPKPIEKKSFLDDVVHFKAKDSVRFNLKGSKAFLYKEGEIQYQKIDLKSDYIDLDFRTKVVSAKGVEDSAGILRGTPVFKDDDQEYKIKELAYGFESKRAIIREVITTEGEGFLHGETVKKMDNNEMYIKNGKFTTCPLEHPHFDFRFGKAKIIPNDKIVTGPVYMTIEDIPLPLALPFGFFPNTQKRTSGVILPAYNNSGSRGYSLRGGGYFWSINPYLNLKLTGDAYTRGSWATYAQSQYKVRYKYSGEYRFGFTDNISTNNPTFSKEHVRGTQLIWRHTQEPQANPNNSFSANVNFTSAGYGRYSNNVTDYFSSTTTSSINFTQNIGSKSSLTLNAGENYNTNTGDMTITLPTIEFRVNQMYPFRFKTSKGNLRWYEKINVRYTMKATNIITTNDSAWFAKSDLENMKNGIQHTIPISSDIKVLKYLNWNNSATYSQVWQFSTIDKFEMGDTSHIEGINKNTGFATGHNFEYSTGLSTTLYGMLQFKKLPMKAIRHTFKPSAFFLYTPYLGSWTSYENLNGETIRYSILEGGRYGVPASQSSGSVNFSLSNSLEIKIRWKKDTINGTKKISLIDNLSISSGYDLMRDSLNWSNLSMSGYTNLFKGVRISYSGSWTPYMRDSLGGLINKYIFEEKNKLFQRTSSTWTLGVSWSLNSKDKKTEEKSESVFTPYNPVFSNIYDAMLDPVDFDIPWDLNIEYNISYGNTYLARKRIYQDEVIQSLRLSGHFSLTPRWKVNFGTGYDFKNKEITYTNIGIRRDLHCWEMSFDWEPIGARKQWTFTIRVKSSMLQDLKYDKRKDFRDNY